MLLRPFAPSALAVLITAAPLIAAANVTPSLEVHAKVVRADGKIGELVVQDGGVLRSGDRLQARVRAPRDGYVYVIAYGSSGRVTLLHPFGGNAEDARVTADKPRTVPAPGVYLPLDNRAGRETLFAVWSEAPLQGLSRLLVRMEGAGGDPQRAEQILRESFPDARRLAFRHLEAKPNYDLDVISSGMADQFRVTGTIAPLEGGAARAAPSRTQRYTIVSTTPAAGAEPTTTGLPPVNVELGGLRPIAPAPVEPGGLDTLLEPVPEEEVLGGVGSRLREFESNAPPAPPVAPERPAEEPQSALEPAVIEPPRPAPDGRDALAGKASSGGAIAGLFGIEGSATQSGATSPDAALAGTPSADAAAPPVASFVAKPDLSAFPEGVSIGSTQTDEAALAAAPAGADAATGVERASPVPLPAPAPAPDLGELSGAVAATEVSATTQAGDESTGSRDSGGLFSVLAGLFDGGPSSSQPDSPPRAAADSSLPASEYEQEKQPLVAADIPATAPEAAARFPSTYGGAPAGASADGGRTRTSSDVQHFSTPPELAAKPAAVSEIVVGARQTPPQAPGRGPLAVDAEPARTPFGVPVAASSADDTGSAGEAVSADADSDLLDLFGGIFSTGGAVAVTRAGDAAKPRFAARDGDRTATAATPAPAARTQAASAPLRVAEPEQPARAAPSASLPASGSAEEAASGGPFGALGRFFDVRDAEPSEGAASPTSPLAAPPVAGASVAELAVNLQQGVVVRIPGPAPLPDATASEGAGVLVGQGDRIRALLGEAPAAPTATMAPARPAAVSSTRPATAPTGATVVRAVPPASAGTPSDSAVAREPTATSVRQSTLESMGGSAASATSRPLVVALQPSAAAVAPGAKQAAPASSVVVAPPLPRLGEPGQTEAAPVLATLQSAPDRQAARTAARAVVRVVTPGGSGSGALIDRAGHVVTNWHLVDGYASVTVLLKDPAGDTAFAARPIRARVVRYSRFADLALLRLEQVPGDVVPLALGDTAQLREGRVLHAIGHPGGGGWSHTPVVVTRFKEDGSWYSGRSFLHKASLVRGQAEGDPGADGAALLDADMNLVAVSAQATRRGDKVHAVGVDTIRSFLEGTGPGAVASGG